MTKFAFYGRVSTEDRLSASDVANFVVCDNVTRLDLLHARRSAAVRRQAPGAGARGCCSPVRSESAMATSGSPART